ncbi:MAG: ATP synthase subunit I [Deltaproteobacteria bacterium]|nr:ATP synthase subunit I [Deltaproteobacteria bacterium]
MKQTIIQKISLGTGIVLILLGGLFFHFHIAISIGMGFFLSYVNFCLLKWAYGQMIHRSVPRGLLFLSFIGKYLFLILGLGASVLYFNLHLLGLLVGISSLLVAEIISASIRIKVRNI